MTLFRPGQPIRVKARTERQERRRIIAQGALLKKCIALIGEYEVLILEYKLLLDEMETGKTGKPASCIALINITEALKTTLNCYGKIVDEFANTRRRIANINKNPDSAYALVFNTFIELHRGYTNLQEQYERLQVNT